MIRPRTALFLSPLALALLLAPQAARAAEPAVAAEMKCDFGSDIAALRAAEATPKATSSEPGTLYPVNPELDRRELVEGFEMRREVLLKIIDCAEGEVAALEGGIKKVSLPDDDTKRLAALLLTRAGKIADDYAVAKEKIADADLKSLKGIAREVAAVRRDAYLPLWDMSRAYVVWSTNRELLERAGKRLAEAKQTLASRKLLEQVVIADLVERASVNLLRAREADYRAIQSIERFERDRALTHFRDTLDNLHGMYQALLNLSGAVKAIR